MPLAPIVLFAYNRPEHTHQTLAALAQNHLAQDSVLYAFCDGAKRGSSARQLEKIEETRKLIREEATKNNFKEVVITEQEQNLGLADSIVSGVTELIEKYGKVIVLEDDIVTSKGFLKFMNEALDFYEIQEQVMHISGYMFPADLNTISLENDTFFYRSASCWGWATWQRAWQSFDTNTAFLLKELKSKKLLREFDLDNTYQFSKQLELNLQGKIKTWAVKWYASVFLQNGLCLHPKKSLVQNIGTDNSGDNSPKTNHFWHSELAEEVKIKNIPIQENLKVVEQMKVYYSKFELSFLERIRNRWRHFFTSK